MPPVDDFALVRPDRFEQTLSGDGCFEFLKFFVATSFDPPPLSG
jgi:hypothetical protein